MSPRSHCEPLLEDHDEGYFQYFKPRRSKNRATTALLAIALILSIGLNFTQVLVYNPSPNLKKFGQEDTCGRSQIANLRDNEVDVKWLQSSDYTSEDSVKRDRVWDAINYDSGIVAVPKPWAEQKGLRLGADFPWDTSRSMYFVNAFHGLHCVKYIYRSLKEYKEGIPQTSAEGHILHCLDQLRADIECSADDTLRETTADRNKTTAVGQIRQCRSFDQLKAWTLAHSGCYRFGNATFEDAQESQLPRKRYCPEGSPELDKVREYFGKGQDWTPVNDKVWSWFDTN